MSGLLKEAEICSGVRRLKKSEIINMRRQSLFRIKKITRSGAVTRCLSRPHQLCTAEGDGRCRGGL
jgi:hypothetical protein